MLQPVPSRQRAAGSNSAGSTPNRYSDARVLDHEATDPARTGLGARLRQLRLEQDPPMSLRALARAAGVDHSYIQRLEAGDRRLPGPDVLRALAWALMVPPADLLIAAGYIPVEAAWQVREAVDDASYRLLLRQAESVRDSREREFIAAAIRTAIGTLPHPPRG